MPPVRWKICLCITGVLILVASTVEAQQMQDPISMSSDGWRPIVGTRRQSINGDHPVSHYPVVQSELIDIEATTLPVTKIQKAPVKNVAYSKGSKGNKIKPISKTTGSYVTGPTGPQYPSSQNQQIKKPGVKKVSLLQSKPRKPVRGQAMAHSTRNEVFIRPPSQNQGVYSFGKPIPTSNLNTREVQGIGLLGGNQFSLNQPNAPIEFANQYPLPGGTFFQRPAFLFTKPVQNDEFTRNLAPPPRSQQSTKANTQYSVYAFKEGGPITDASSNFPQFGVKANQYTPQVAPIFDYTNQQQQQQQPQRQSQKQKGQAADVQVTKENLKQFTQNGPSSFGLIPGRNNFPIQFVDYDFHSVKSKPTNLPSTLTYEVTEGKWLDTSSQQYQFRPINTFIQRPKVSQQINARPGLLFQAEPPPTRPPVFPSPLVDISVPPFLPTPHRPDNIAPTSPTHSEASTVFNKVTDKMNRYRNGALNNNPLLFDIKEVSTHYPVVGIPDVPSEGNTETPLPINENGEISNEITTQKELELLHTRRPIKDSTRATVSRDPTKTRISNRRPRPRRPTTTTTEETVVDVYEPLKEAVEEIPKETEKPRRRRPRPPNYRQKSENEEQVQNKPEEQSSSPQRGKYRFRTRERPSNDDSNTSTSQRKRFRPSFSENIIREQIKPSQDESSESSIEHQQNSYENYPTVNTANSYEPSRSQETTNDDTNTQTEVHNSPFIEEIHPVTNNKPRVSITSSHNHESNPIPPAPENEVDYTTQTSVEQEEPREETTAITTTPQTTTTTTETTTSKTHRIRVRPNKFDASNRPRFSVKEFREKFNQHTSTTPSSTTESRHKSSTTDNLRLRFPNRRTRPGPSATTAISRIDEDSTEDTLTTTNTPRQRFKPNQPRFHLTTEADNVITENSVKSVNTRLRPFGRIKSTTEATTAGTKVSIRPNLFSSRRRSGYPSLKNRLDTKVKKNEVKDDEEEHPQNNSDQDDEGEVQKGAESGPSEVSTGSTEFTFYQVTSEETSTEATEASTTEDLKVDDMIQSQRVSDLTSSFKDYDKPGAFNSVGSTSRSIPNHFTLSTDDPILPIEAFFPNLKDKSKER
ncbi:proteoglycan 4-like [Sitophilus oryzae]|uniref:Proteoglycan 4-like n=1 Tax=Sitophilus oryzae TaxID=7048 RepID=A0A6J2YU22_SITOR|nr:proteoglycan 4-like [Sitophilus oryzae]